MAGRIPIQASLALIAISSASLFGTDDPGQTWRSISRALKSQYISDPTAEVGPCVHGIAMHRSGQGVLLMQTVPGCGRRSLAPR